MLGFFTVFFKHSRMMKYEYFRGIVELSRLLGCKKSLKSIFGNFVVTEKTLKHSKLD
ncbi:hypothetical protein [uncultured Gammaproteobacteria bacterium]|nr:hypothetical protein [uncultured Gammaproteobacteria bacterium]